MRRAFLKILHRLRSLAYTVWGWSGASVSRSAIIKGDPRKISLGEGCVVEPGSVLSTEWGGRITLGKHCTVLTGAMVLSYGGDIELGDHCSVNPYCILYGHGGLHIGSFVRFAAHCVVIPANHGIDRDDTPIYLQPLTRKGIVIGTDVWVGAGARILDGVTIGDGAVVGAGAVVTGDLPPYSISGGVPARVVRYRAAPTRDDET
jgi:acetyltransferase-like isoleucine patch superfamily enzyme